MNKIKLLFVENNALFSETVKNSLQLTGEYEVQTASNGKEGLEMYDAFDPDIIVSDIDLPVLDGMEMVKRIREKDASIPILLSSERAESQNVLKGYALNIDNFIRKPYIPEELNAHMKAVFRRNNKSSSMDEKRNVIRLGNSLFDVDEQVLRYQGINHQLTARGTQILEILCREKGKLVLRKYLLQELWHSKDFFASRSLDVYICKLRRYLSSDPTVQIKTVRGRGLLLSINLNEQT